MNKPLTKELILYVLNKEVMDSWKLNLMLWYIDLASYRDHGTCITGGVYIKAPEGPYLEGLAELVEEMIAEGSLSWEESPETERIL